MSPYRGHAFGWIFLVVLGAINLFRGSVHLFTEDGGASRIATIPLENDAVLAAVVLTLFAGMGVNQLLMAAIDFAVALRFRAFVPLLIGYHTAVQLGTAVVLWWWRPLPVAAPGKYGVLYMLPVMFLALWAATRQPREVSPAAVPAPQS